ncbi:hypothetical protein BG844_24755 [Couchioplanes caeruleus subsp. caeruleus]|uniref:Uncharacterized protein n=1 Tax=Couchioplanes caeruleus subsp. caeruleus TaxID=56427 RepID=A0A1K0GR34_9ACTN|nr:hypothetical protein BG844_24755 [Couchioplanes caeruleus subsp. caeruleus]
MLNRLASRVLPRTSCPAQSRANRALAPASSPTNSATRASRESSAWAIRRFATQDWAARS